MAETREIRMQAGELGFALQALSLLRGRKGCMLAWRLVQIMEPLNTMQQAFIDRVKPFVDEKGAPREGADLEGLQAVCEEEVSFQAAPISLVDDLADMEIEDGENLTAEAAMGLLRRLGLVCACPRS